MLLPRDENDSSNRYPTRAPSIFQIASRDGILHLPSRRRIDGLAIGQDEGRV
jgi:hypothetical protein